MTQYFDHYNRPLTRDEYYHHMCASKDEVMDYLRERLSDDYAHMTDDEFEAFLKEELEHGFIEMPPRYEGDEPRYIGVCDANHF